MASASASDRQDAVTKVVTKWYKDFEQSVSDDDAAIANFLSVYDPEIVWTDHGFQAQRTGHEAILGLQKSFTYCNQPFKSELKALHHTSSGAVAELVWVGRCTNDVVRPDGQIVVKAHGKDFRNHVCFVIEISPENKITKIDEYYNKIWEDGVGVENYVQVRGASMKN